MHETCRRLADALVGSLEHLRQSVIQGAGGRLLLVLLLVFSNIFMIYAWYGHLNDLKDRPVAVAIAVSWGVALLEYCLQVPANRMGYQHYSLAQLKVIQEVITIGVFGVFSVSYMKMPLRLDLLWAGICLVGAAYFTFRSASSGG